MRLSNQPSDVTTKEYSWVVKKYYKSPERKSNRLYLLRLVLIFITQFCRRKSSYAQFLEDNSSLGVGVEYAFWHPTFNQRTCQGGVMLMNMPC